MTGESITNFHAKGCFIVLQGSHNTADIYQVLSRNKQSVSGTVIAPSSNYTVYGYDIEDNALPNQEHIEPRSGEGACNSANSEIQTWRISI